MTNRLELNWRLDGFVDEQRYYCSETPIDIENLPVPKAILAGNVRTHIDSDCVAGKKYYLRIGAVKNNLEKMSDEKSMLFGKEWTPSHLANAAKIWLSSENVVKDSNNRISQVVDLTGNGNHFTQSSNAAKPLLENNLIRFDGVDDAVLCVNKAVFKNISTAWIFAIYKKRTSGNDDAGGKCVFYSAANNAVSNRFNLLAKRYSSGKPAFAAKTLITDTTAIVESDIVDDGNSLIVYAEAKYSSGSTRLIVNSLLQGSGAITAQNTSNVDAPDIVIGAGSNGANADIDVKTIIVGTNSSPTSDELQRLEGWAAHKYALTDKLPSDHPYKILVPVL